MSAGGEVTAGDLLIRAVDRWMDHLVNRCDGDGCSVCERTFSRMRAAHRIWKASGVKPSGGAALGEHSRAAVLLELQFVAYSMLGFEPDEKFIVSDDARDCVESLFELATEASRGTAQ